MPVYKKVSKLDFPYFALLHYVLLIRLGEELLKELTKCCEYTTDDYPNLRLSSRTCMCSKVEFQKSAPVFVTLCSLCSTSAECSFPGDRADNAGFPQGSTAKAWSSLWSVLWLFTGHAHARSIRVTGETHFVLGSTLTQFVCHLRCCHLALPLVPWSCWATPRLTA